MSRYNSPPLRIAQTHYPERDQSHGRQRLDSTQREDSVDHGKYRPIITSSSKSRRELHSPDGGSRTNLFENALSRLILSGQRKPIVNNELSDRGILPRQPVGPVGYGQLVEKTRRVSDLVETGANLNPLLLPHTRVGSLSTTLIQNHAQRNISSPSSSQLQQGLYKPFFPRAQSPPRGILGTNTIDNRNSKTNGADSIRILPGGSYIEVPMVSPRTIPQDRASTKYGDEYEDIEAIKQENRDLKLRIQEYERDQALVLQLNELLLRKLDAYTGANLLQPTEVEF